VLTNVNSHALPAEYNPAMLGKRQRISTADLTSGPITRSLFRLAWPVVLANLLQTSYSFVNMLWLGRLGKSAVAAPTISWPLVFLMMSIGGGLTVAGTALVAQYTGARRPEEANEAAGQVVAFVAILAAALAAVGVLAARPLMLLMGAGPDLLRDATTYLRVTYAGLPALFGTYVVTALLNGVGDTFTPMVLMGLSVVANVGLDWLLIFKHGSFPGWGVAGAAAASVFCQAGVTAVGMYLLFSGRLRVHIRPRHLRLRWKRVKEIVAIGLPSSVGQSGTALGFAVMMGTLARFGTAVVGAFGIGNRIISVALMPATGLGQATAAMVGQNLGAEKPDRAQRAAWTGMVISAGFLVVASAFVYVLRGSLVRLFIADAEVVQLGAPMFSVTALAFPFMAILQVIIGTYQGSGHTFYSMFFDLFRLWGLRVPLVYLLGFTLNMGASGVWWSMPLSNAGTAVLALGFFLTGNWKHRVIKEAPLPVEATVEEGIPLQR